jgi:hypothetical protein
MPAAITNGSVVLNIAVDYTEVDLATLTALVAGAPGTYSKKVFKALDTGIYHYVDGQDNVGVYANVANASHFFAPYNESLDADAFPTFDTAVVLSDLNLIITDLEALPTTPHANAFLTETLSPGSYITPGAATLAGTLTLNGGGITGATFVIRSPAAITPAASVNIVLTGGTLPENVHFLATGAMAVGAGCTINGNIICKAGAPSLGVGCTLVGRMLTLAGAASSASSNATLPTSAGVIDYRSCADMIMFTGTTPATNTGGAASYYEGGIASHTGTVTGFGLAGGVFTTYPSGSSIPPQNNYLPTETSGSVTFGNANIVYIFPAANLDITGFDAAGFTNNQIITIVNLGAGDATLKTLSPNSTNDNKIAANTDIVIKQYQSKDVTRINGVLNKWIVKGNN